MGPVKRICVFEHSVMTNFNCACPAIQRGQGSGFLSEGSSWLTACMSEQRRDWQTARMRRLAWTFAARIGDKYQIRLTRSRWYIILKFSHYQTEVSLKSHWRFSALSGVIIFQCFKLCCQDKLQQMDTCSKGCWLACSWLLLYHKMQLTPVCTLQPVHGNWANSEDPDQSHKTLQLIRVYTVCIQDCLFNIK